MSSSAFLPQRPAKYRRISDDRRKDELGVTRQDKLTTVLGTDRGWNMAAAVTYTDNDLTAAKKDGKLPDRPDFDRLRDDIAAGKVDGVLAYDLDRLLREPFEGEQFWALCERTRMHRILTVADDVDISTGHGLLVARIKTAVAAEEIRKLRQRTVDKQVELAERGLPGGGGRRPFGYSCARRHRPEDCSPALRCGHTQDPEEHPEPCCRHCEVPGCPHDGIGLVPAEAEVLREAVAHILTGGTVEAARDLIVARGFKTTVGNDWDPATLRRLLASPRIAGLREHKGEVVGDAVWPAIIDRQTWEDLRAERQRRYRFTRPFRSHLLSGIARCGREGCGAKLYAQVEGGTDRVRYDCRKAKGGCGRLAVDGANLEAHVCDVVGAWLADADLAEGVTGILQGDPGRDIDRLAEDVSKAEKRLVALAREREEEGYDIIEYRAMREPVVARLDAARAALAEARQRARPSPFAGIAPGDLLATFLGLDRGGQREFIRDLVGEIVVYPVGKGHRVFNPDRVRVVPVWATGG